MTDHERTASQVRLDGAARVVALVDALRGIPPELSPVARASTQAIREQIYHGYERPLVRARGVRALWGKYEQDRAWSTAAVAAVRSGEAQRGSRHLNRDHVFEAAAIVKELMDRPRTVAETADLLDLRLVTCTVLADEHARLGKAPKTLVGWERYEWAEVEVVPRYPKHLAAQAPRP